VILVARAEAYLMGKPEPRAVIDRLIRFGEAGADCLYAPGITDMAAIGDMVRAVAPLPINILMFGAHMSVPALADLGVRRVSVGGALANAAWRGFETAAQQFLTQGTMPS
jgi:2-methylisocitrate lyase-like PEP mutase family enzyme